MTRTEAARYILSRWLDGADNFNVEAIMVQLICRGFPARRQDVRDIVRLYVNRQTENKGYKVK